MRLQFAHDEKTEITRQLRAELLDLREEKATAIAQLEEDKVDCQKRWQDDVARLQEAQALAESNLEREKVQLLRKLQGALEEARRFQSEQVSLEASLAEERAVIQAGVGAQKTAAQRNWCDDLARQLEEKTAEMSKLELSQVQLRRQLGQEKEELEEKHYRIVADLEAEKTKLHQHWETALAESFALQEENAELVASFDDKAAEARRKWMRDFMESVPGLQDPRSEDRHHPQDAILGTAAQTIDAPTLVEARIATSALSRASCSSGAQSFSSFAGSGRSDTA